MKKLLPALFFAAATVVASASQISLQGCGGQWVSAINGGGGDVMVTGGAASAWETFTLDDLNGGNLEDGDAVTFQTQSGHFLCAEGSGGQAVVANRVAVGGWEVFTVHKLNGGGSINSGDQIAIQVSNGQYWCAESGGGSILNANRNVASGWETFTITIGSAGGSGTPQVTFNPSTTSAQPGQTITFSVSATCTGGLNEIGLEGCDSSGNPISNLGAVGAGGTSAGYTFSWQAPGAGTYYFDAYAWNVDRSALTRATVISVTVGNATGTPQVTFTPSSNSVEPGQVVTFSVSASCSDGLNEIGLEGCDSNGNAVSNLGIAGVGGGSASSTFSWQAPGAGTYYFDAYAWNSSRSVLTRAAVISVTVGSVSGTPEVSFMPYKLSVDPGEVLVFGASAECAGGLSEIGFERCDSNGNPTTNLGSVGVSGATGSTTFTWQSASPGTYYFTAYAWNASHSALGRGSVFSIVVTSGARPPSAMPEVTLSASATSISAGQGVNFTVSASCTSGLDEIGLEACDASGEPLAAVGAVAVRGNLASQVIPWSTPQTPDGFSSDSYFFWVDSPGIYYFAAYAWNSDLSHRTRSAVIAVTVTFEANTHFDGWTVWSSGVALSQTYWAAWDAHSESYAFYFGNLPETPAPASIDYHEFDEMYADLQADRDALQQTLREGIAADEAARLQGKVDEVLAKGKGVQLVDEAGNVIKTILPANANGLNWTVTTVYTYSNRDGGFINGGEIVRLPQYIVNGNNQDTFDWNGYNIWMAQHGFPNVVPQSGIGASDGNTTNAKDQFPYAQQQHASCTVASIRNLLHELGVKSIPSEAKLRAVMAKAAGIPESDFDDPAKALSVHFMEALNAALGMFNLKAENPEITGDADFLAKMAATKNGFALVTTSEGINVSSGVNHMVVLHYNPATGGGTMINSANQTSSRVASIETYADSDALWTKIPNFKGSNGHQTGRIFIISNK